MKIGKDKVITLNYRILDEDGEIIEESQPGHPMVYLHGHNGLMPALEDALESKTAGEEISARLLPEQAYGEIQENQQQRIPMKHLQGAKKWKPGMIATVHTEDGNRQVTIVKTGHTMATVDTNHPLAGKTLDFEIEVLEIRDASDEEITHGHAHGPGGHQH